MNRPSVAELPQRRPKPLHRTLPMWVRDADGNGNVEWRVYAPHRFGGALYMTIYGKPGKTRSDIAAEIRAARRVIWGRTKIELLDDEAPVKVRRPRAKAAIEEPAAALDATDQPQLETADVDSAPLESPADDLPPWPTDDSSGAVTARAADEEASTQDESPELTTVKSAPLASPETLTAKPGLASHEQGSLF